MAPAWFTQERREFLEQNGYVVIPNVATQAFCDRIKDGIVEFIQEWEPELTLDKPKSWKAATLPAGTIHGINRIAAQTQIQWDVRQHPNVVKLFSEYWSTDKKQYSPEDMVTSMDAFNFYLGAGSRQGDSQKGGRGKFWAHVDETPAKKGAQPLGGRCLQGFLNLNDCQGDNDGGLVVWTRSHLVWKKFFEEHDGDKNWFKFTQEHIDELEEDASKYVKDGDAEFGGLERIRVRAPAGAFVVWFSRTIHQNDWPFMRNPEAPAPKDRAVVYVCQGPRHYLTPKDIKNRKKAFEECRQTSHWPAGGQVSLFGAPRFYGKRGHDEEKPRYDKFRQSEAVRVTPDLTALGKSLLGFE